MSAPPAGSSKAGAGRPVWMRCGRCEGISNTFLQQNACTSSLQPLRALPGVDSSLLGPSGPPLSFGTSGARIRSYRRARRSVAAHPTRNT